MAIFNQLKRNYLKHHKYSFKISKISPKLFRFFTLSISSIVQIILFQIFQSTYTKYAVIYYGALSVITLILSHLELGRFANLIKIVNSDSDDATKNRNLYQNIQSFSLVTLISTPLLIVTFILFGPSEENKISSVFTIFVLSLIQILNFSTKNLLASGKSQIFFLISMLQQIVFLLSVIILLQTRLSYDWIILIAYIFLLISLFTICKKLNLFEINQFKSFKVGISNILPGSYALKFFYINILLGIMFQYDRLWINKVELNENISWYFFTNYAYLAATSILSLDYQQIWRMKSSRETINYSNLFRRTVVSSIFLGIVFFFGLTSLSYFLESLNYDSVLNNLFFAFAITGQGILNYYSGLSSHSESLLLKHIKIIAIAIIIRYAILLLMNNLTGNGINSHELIVSYLLVLIFFQIPLVTYVVKHD